jgi:hypothetical protein
LEIINIKQDNNREAFDLSNLLKNNRNINVLQLDCMLHYTVFTQIIEHCPKMSKLELTNVSFLKISSIHTLLTSSPRLRNFKIRANSNKLTVIYNQNKNIDIRMKDTTHAIGILLDLMKDLKSIKIRTEAITNGSIVTTVTDTELRSFIDNNCTTLTIFDVQCSKELEYQTLVFAMEKCKILHSITIYYSITNAELTNLFASPNIITHITLTKTRNLHHEAIAHVLKNNVKIVYVKLRTSINVTQSDIQKLRGDFPEVVFELRNI